MKFVKFGIFALALATSLSLSAAAQDVSQDLEEGRA